MKYTILIIMLIIITSESKSQHKVQITEDSIVNKWTHAVINIECTASPSEKIIGDYTKLLRQKLIDTIEFRRLWDSLLKNPQRSLGTAIFLKYRNQHFLLSARHVFADAGTYDTNRISISIVLVETLNTPPNDESNVNMIDTPLKKGIPGFIEIDSNIRMSNFRVRYEGVNAEHRSLIGIKNAEKNKIYFLSSITDDVGLINLDNIEWEGPEFVKTLYKRGYSPIEISDIDTSFKVKRLDSILCIGFPQETMYGMKSKTWWQGLYEANIKSIPMITKGFLLKNVSNSNSFEAAVFTYHGFSGGPVVSGNKLIGIISGFNPILKTVNTPTINTSLMFESKFIKSSTIYKFIKSF